MPCEQCEDSSVQSSHGPSHKEVFGEVRLTAAALVAGVTSAAAMTCAADCVQLAVHDGS